MFTFKQRELLLLCAYAKKELIKKSDVILSKKVTNEQLHLHHDQEIGKQGEQKKYLSDKEIFILIHRPSPRLILCLSSFAFFSKGHPHPMLSFRPTMGLALGVVL